MQDNQIHFILTGGTIDAKTQGKERDVLYEKSVVPEYLNNSDLQQKFMFTQVIWKDSGDITTKDRENILQIVEASPAKKIILTHGTYTMVETANFLKSTITKKDQVIILTGAIMPLKAFENSDAPGNLNFAIGQATRLSPGVYVCMNGEVFQPEHVVKDLDSGKFVSV